MPELLDALVAWLGKYQDERIYNLTEIDLLRLNAQLRVLDFVPGLGLILAQFRLEPA